MRLILLGAGGLAEEVEDLALDLGHTIERRLTTGEVRYLSTIPHDGVVLAVGSPITKQLFLDAVRPYTPNWVTLISPHAKIGRGTIIKPGCVIQHGVVITTNVYIDPHTYVNLNCTIGHGSTIGTLCTINPGANISGNVTLQPYVLIGTGAQILEEINIDEHATVGAGAVVNRDVPRLATVVGVPARRINA